MRVAHNCVPDVATKGLTASCCTAICVDMKRREWIGTPKHSKNRSPKRIYYNADEYFGGTVIASNREIREGPAGLKAAPAESSARCKRRGLHGAAEGMLWRESICGIDQSKTVRALNSVCAIFSPPSRRLINDSHPETRSGHSRPSSHRRH
jgi:hypothetical protein